jgi:hypothetical protein
MWKAVLLKVFYYAFFIIIFVFAVLIFLRLTDFYFGSVQLNSFLDDFIRNIDF